MKKLSFGAVIAIIIAIVIANRGGDKVAQDTSPTPSPETFTVVVVASDVLVKNPGDTDFKKIAAQADIMAGTEIKTSAAGKAKLLYPNGTITNIDVDSYIKIEALNGKGEQSRISIIFGGLWSKIQNVLGTDEYYEVETDNTVASVRGTIFWTEFRNKVTKITGIENKVRVRAKDATTKKVIEGTDVDVESGEETSVNTDTLPKERERLAKRVLAAADLQQDRIKERVLDYVEEKDLKKDQVKNLVRKVRDNNIKDRPFIQKMIERRLLQQDGSPIPSVTPGTTATPRVSATMTPRVSATPEPTVKPTATPDATVAPTATPDLRPILESVFPKSISASQEITVNGRYFKVGRDTSQIKQVLIGGKNALKFNVLDSLTIFATPDSSLLAGTYDVTVVSTTDDKATLTGTLTIQ